MFFLESFLLVSKVVIILSFTSSVRIYFILIHSLIVDQVVELRSFMYGEMMHCTDVELDHGEVPSSLIAVMVVLSIIPSCGILLPSG